MKSRGAALALSLAVLAGAGLAAALLGAFAAWLLSLFFYVALLIPAAWGLGLGAALAAGIRWARWPDRRAALAAAILATLVSVGVFHSLQNGRFRDRGIGQLGSLRAYEEVLVERKGGTGFWAELSLRADTGMNLSKPGRRGRKPEAPMISGAAMYAYWLLELGLVAAGAVVLALRQVRRPFCGACRRWYSRAGSVCVAETRIETALRALDRKDFAVFTGCLTSNGSPHRVTMEACPACTDSPVRIVLDAEVKDGRGRPRRRVLFDRSFSRESLYSLRTVGFVLSARVPKGKS
jgi:hypothetical protein